MHITPVSGTGQLYNDKTYDFNYTFPVICYDADRLVCIVYAKVSFSTETVQRYNTIQYAVKRNEEEYTSEINFTQLHATNRLCIA